MIKSEPVEPYEHKEFPIFNAIWGLINDAMCDSRYTRDATLDWFSISKTRHEFDELRYIPLIFVTDLEEE